MKEIRFARKIIKTLIKDHWHYSGRMIMDLVLMFVRCGVLLVLYAYVFELRNGTIHGTTFSVVAWSIFFYFAFSTLRLREIARMIMQDVQSGAVEAILTKPVSYIFYRMVWQIGNGFNSFIVVTIFGSLLLVFLVGIPGSMKIGIFVPSFLLVFLGASILSLILYTLVGFIAFWIEDINPIFWLVDKTIMILGGAYLPIALFPPFLYKMSLWSPFGASQFITHTVNDSWQSQWYMHIGIQVVWIGIGGVALYALNRFAQRRISINGG